MIQFGDVKSKYPLKLKKREFAINIIKVFVRTSNVSMITRFIKILSIVVENKKLVQELTHFGLVSAVFVVMLEVMIKYIVENIMKMKDGNVNVIVKINQKKRNVDVEKLGQLTNKREKLY